MFCTLKDSIPSTITISTRPRRNIEPINKNSTLGEQLKYYRRMADINQTDLCEKLGYSKDALQHTENREMKLIDINLLKAVIKYLNIENKININDDYISFLLDNPYEKIINIRQSMNLTRQEFANMLDVSITSVRRWELGNSNITRTKFEQLKKCMS